MSKVAATSSLHDLAEANQGNFLAFARTLEQQGLASVDETDGLLRCTSSFDHPLVNCVASTRVAPERADQAIAETLAFYAGRGRSPMWMLWPNDEPTDMADRLTAAGWQCIFSHPCMSLTLALLRDRLEMPAGLSITRVASLDDLRICYATMGAGFGMTGSPMLDLFMASFDATGYGPDANVVNYIGWCEGKPVATCLLSLDAGVAGIYNVSTLEAYRRRGIGRALTVRALLDARKRGYEVAMLQSSEMGASVYREIGFVEVGAHRGFVPGGV